MKLYIGLLAAASATALIGPGLVNTSLAADGDNFVIRGDATKTILEQNEINVATAEAVSKACVDEAVKQGVKVSISIFDQFGELVYLYRMDGQTKVAVDTAMMKARTVLNTRQPSKATMNAVLSGPLLGAAPAVVRQFRQFRRPADRDQRQPVHRRHRGRRLGAQASGMERRNLRLARAHQGHGPAAGAAARRAADAIIRPDARRVSATERRHPIAKLPNKKRTKEEWSGGSGYLPAPSPSLK